MYSQQYTHRFGNLQAGDVYRLQQNLSTVHDEALSIRLLYSRKSADQGANSAHLAE